MSPLARKSPAPWPTTPPATCTTPYADIDLSNLGPLTQQVLASVGITTLEQLRESGSVAVYLKAKSSGAHVSLHLLWLLEAAVSGLPWQTVARQHRTRLLLALDKLERRGFPSDH